MSPNLPKPEESSSSATAWTDFASHTDLKPKRADYVGMLAASFVLIAALVFGFLEHLHGQDVSAIAVLATLLSIGWLSYQLTRIRWKQYASWVFEYGKRLDCMIDLTPSGELDHPFIILQESNRLSELYKTRVYAIQYGRVGDVGYDAGYPKNNSNHQAIVVYDEKKHGNAIIFLINGHRFWCKAVPNRIS